MNALAMWRCRACGAPQQTAEECDECHASRDGSVVSVQQNRIDGGNVYNIHAPAQFNMNPGLEPEPETITAPPLVPESRSVFSWAPAVWSFVATVVVLTTLVVSVLALMQPKRVIYQCPNTSDESRN